MESKITIHTGDNHKPVIKVIEKSSDDVRDNLVQNFRRLLKHESKTATINFISVPLGENLHAGYFVIPVEDEIKYFNERCFELINYTGVNMNPEQRRFIIDFFEWMKNPTLNPRVLSDNEGMLNSK